MDARRDGAYASLIAGGTKGIGLAIALKLASPGTHLFLNYHADDAAANGAAVELRQKGATVHLLKEDIGTAAGARALIDRVAEATSRLDSIVHSAALPNPGQLACQDLGEVMAAINVGGLALLYLVQPAMKLLGSGSTVLFLSGSAVDLVLPNHGALAAAKAVGECMIRYLAIECAPQGINFNTLRLGPVDTGLFRSVRAAAPAGTPKEVAPPPSAPGGRRLTAEDVAEAAAFLLSPQAAMIRGQSIMVDGGLNTTVRGR
ncbi:MAG: SDR family oxidoreductase [Alphaproteobacteria bacterium]